MPTDEIGDVPMRVRGLLQIARAPDHPHKHQPGLGEHHTIRWNLSTSTPFPEAHVKSRLSEGCVLPWKFFSSSVIA